MSITAPALSSIVVSPSVLLSLGDQISVREVQFPGSTAHTGLFFGTTSPTTATATVYDLECGNIPFSHALPKVEEIRMFRSSGDNQSEDKSGRDGSLDYSPVTFAHVLDSQIHTEIYNHKAVGMYIAFTQFSGSIGNDKKAKEAIAKDLGMLWAFLFPYSAQLLTPNDFLTHLNTLSTPNDSPQAIVNDIALTPHQLDQEQGDVYDLTLTQRLQLFLLSTLFTIISKINGITTATQEKSENDSKTPNLKQLNDLYKAYLPLLNPTARGDAVNATPTNTNGTADNNQADSDFCLLYLPLLLTFLPPQLLTLPSVEALLSLSIGMVPVTRFSTVLMALLPELCAHLRTNNNPTTNPQLALTLTQILSCLPQLYQHVDQIDEIATTTGANAIGRGSDETNTATTTNQQKNTAGGPKSSSPLRISLLSLSQKLSILKHTLLLEQSNPNTVPTPLLNQIKQTLVTFLLNPIGDLLFTRQLGTTYQSGHQQSNSEKNSITEANAISTATIQPDDDDVMMNELLLQLQLHIGDSAFKQAYS